LKQIKLKNISVKWRLFFYISAFAAATLLLLWLFQVVFLQGFYKSIKVNDIKSAASGITKNIDSDDLQTYIKTVSQKKDVSIVIASLDGEVLYSEETSPDSVLLHLSQSGLLSLIEEAQTNNGDYLRRFDRGGIIFDPGKNSPFPARLPQPGKSMMESILFTVIADKQDGSRAAIILNANISPVDATVQTIRVQLVYVTIIMLVLALLLALFISRRISKPIIKMNATAKELAKGQYNVVFDENGYREISELGSTLNFTAGELAKTEALRRELIANISHDLRTPLTMITGYAEVMRDLPGENSQENVQIVIDEAKRLSSLVNDVLDISKLQSETDNLNITSFSITDSTKEILKRYSKLTEQDGYTINYVYDRDVIVKADELKISQVLYNLINNAVTYTGSDKTVTVRQSVAQGLVRIEVIDTGDGIPSDRLNDIWDRYYRIDNAHKRAQVGTGLGLSIVKAILTQHNAKFGVQSVIGQGSVFWFELPVKQ
jgi:signal transduction histidine kinase